MMLTVQLVSIYRAAFLSLLRCDQLLEQAITVERKPVLAICVGMQSLMTASEENGGIACLNQVPGEVTFFGNPHRGSDGTRLKVPHMGWNQVVQKRPHPLWAGIESGTHFYFVHSYHVVPKDPDLVVGTFDYGLSGCAALARDNVFATQFHPEKSHQAGLTLLKNFLSWDGTC